MDSSHPTTASSLLYGHRRRQVLLRRVVHVEGDFSPLDRGLLMLTTAGFVRQELVADGVARCGADLLHFTDSRRGLGVAVVADIGSADGQYMAQLLAAARKRYTNQQRKGLYSFTFPDIAPLLIADKDDEHSSLARAFSYIEEATDYSSFRDPARWTDDLEQALSQLLHVAQVGLVNVDSAMRSMQRLYFADLRRWS